MVHCIVHWSTNEAVILLLVIILFLLLVIHCDITATSIAANGEDGRGGAEESHPTSSPQQPANQCFYRLGKKISSGKASLDSMSVVPTAAIAAAVEKSTRVLDDSKHVDEFLGRSGIRLDLR